MGEMKPEPHCPPELAPELVRRINAALAEVGMPEVTDATQAFPPTGGNACWVRHSVSTEDELAAWFRAANLARLSLGLQGWDDLDHFRAHQAVRFRAHQAVR